MKRILTVCALLALAVVFTGCATGIKTRQIVRFPDQGKTVENPELARVYVLRRPGDKVPTYLVKDGSKRIGHTREGGFLCWERPPGEVAVASYMDKFDRPEASVNLHVEKNTVYYVKQWTTFFDFVKMEAVDQKAGIKLLKKCRPPTANHELAGALKAAEKSGVDLSKYQVVCVQPFATEAGKNIDSTIGNDFGDEIHELLKNGFGPLFRDVRFGAPCGSADELIVTGTIKDYSPGSRLARSMLAGLGAASFDAELVLIDASSQQVLLKAPLSKAWAWGGVMGYSKGIEDMVAQSAIACAATVAQGKGWRAK